MSAILTKTSRHDLREIERVTRGKRKAPRGRRRSPDSGHAQGKRLKRAYRRARATGCVVGLRGFARRESRGAPIQLTDDALGWGRRKGLFA